MDVTRKLAVLADAAKYDASCASSGAPRRGSRGKAGLGNSNGTGICHSYTPDGRCVSLLKILLTNFCLYDCQYCVNRRSSDVPRARFTPEEVARLTLDFYERNYVSGLFLSSGIIRSPDYTMEQLVRVARLLREEHGFRGYIHLKTIPEADPALIDQAARFADRLSVNIELPSERGLRDLAPEKQLGGIRRAMGTIHAGTEADQADKSRSPKRPRYAPGGQSTQMIVGADASSDRLILDTADQLYRRFRLKRVYYSAFSPIPNSPGTVPLRPPPLLREHRLYQADFLLRGYGFQPAELLADNEQLPLDIDPKLAWALRHRDLFPLDLNRAPRELIGRVPGIGLRSAERLVDLRRHRRVRFEDLVRLRCVVAKARPFVVTADHRPRDAGLDSGALRRQLVDAPVQASLWD
ncbi:putative DNA modification/repair radical SAM protein [Alloalcanivorax marinus]|uniref:putative DNA modification/repair radical SAM protein n=1 Tax=Alloalcanivorax marinus TaxID=1177169 RepID=UPI00195E0104|nr:putative DNA modification/repair radical SAM protein [Alloalcanivorax marinus]MBM7335019.1 putative DNA modification/repair radical SAM protein [Alloalcanivorax marinus]